jgi:predicted nucleotide-binding protein
MARVLCIDCEPETVSAIEGAGHSPATVELGYRTGKRNFFVPPHECDLIVCDLKKPACFDCTDWGPGRNDNFHCVLVNAVSNQASLRSGKLDYKHRLIQEGQLPPVIPGTFGADDVLRAIKDASIPFFLFLNDQWVKRAASFPNLFNLSWTFKRTIATRISVDKILTDRLPDLSTKIAIPLQNSISEGPRSRLSTQQVSCTSLPLVTNSVKDVFSQVVRVGSGNVWLLPPFEDNALVITHIASDLSPFKSVNVVSPEAKASPMRPIEVAATATAKPASSIVGPDSRTVFVVHGRDERLRVGIFDFLRSLDLKPLEWTEAVKLTGKGSPYIGEILDTAFSRAQAVVVLLTPDDEARLRDTLRGAEEPAYETQLTPQARPNVLFEAGMAMAGNPDRTILVQVGNLRPFSDIAGRHVIRLDNSIPRRQDLVIRLQSAGCTVNLSGTDWQKTGDLAPPSIQTVAPGTDAS